MAATLSLTETQTLTALRAVLLGYIGTGTEVIRAEVNRVSEPRGADFVVMTPTQRERLSTNVDRYVDGFLVAPVVPGTANALLATQVTVQLDIHGPDSADNAQIIGTLFRDRSACDAFAATGFDIQPLYASDPRQMPFENAEQQTEWRWSIDVVLQANPVVSTPQDFADVVTIGLINVDETFPP